MSASDNTASPAGMTVMVGARKPHMEVLELSTRQVWQSLGPISLEDANALELEPGWVKVGVGTGAMGEHWFERSPGTPDEGPMEERSIGGRQFVFCARPVGQPSLPDGSEGPRQMCVDKYHVLRYFGGTRVQLLRLPDERDFVHVVEGGPEKPSLALPEGWLLRDVLLEEDWVVKLPAPATVFFFPNRDSFQGPIRAPDGRSGDPERRS